MDNNYFSKVRILDGGMGQTLLEKGLKAKGSLWSASALIEEKYHQLVIDTHLDFINSGADVIVTNNFSARRSRTLQNNVDEHFNYANQKAGELALKAKEVSKKNILIAGSLPAQFDTYVPDERDQNLIKKDFFDQANLLKPFIDFFYLDVLSSIREIEIALNVVEKMNFPVLIGMHIRENGKLPSDETITKMVETCKNKNWLGLIASCVSPEIIENTADEVKGLDIPFGFKANLWKEQPLPVGEIVRIDAAGFGENPVDILGSRKDINDEKFFDFSKRMVNKGATILGGCCETKPSHINAISKLKQI
ncbi:homocysteine S-methyltransferase family protein [Pelagibacteraceae bacterium]|jgi:homocysteine S-methyltransferase|nr:homocysteine S-methyltransferase family protein [Pelagibacteraceae bacterium]